MNMCDPPMIQPPSTSFLHLLCAALVLVARPALGELLPTTEKTPDGTFSSQFVLGPTRPGKWGPPEYGTGATVTYSFATGDGYLTDEFQSGGRVVPLESSIPFSKAGIEAEIRRAFDAWEAAANLEFVEIPDDGAIFKSPFTSSGD